MALTIKATPDKMSIPEVDAVSHMYRNLGGTNHMQGGKIWFPFTNAGEGYFTKEGYAICNAYGLKCEGGMFYHIFTALEVDNLVPVDWPYSKDAEGERISYENYFQKRSQYLLADGTWLFRITRENVGLSDVDRLIYQGALCGEGEQFLVKAEGVALMPKSNEGI